MSTRTPVPEGTSAQAGDDAAAVHQHGDSDQVLLDWDMGDTDEIEQEEAVLDIYRHNPVVWTSAVD